MTQSLDQRYLAAIRLRREQVSSFKDYPFCIPAVRRLRRLEFHPAVTFLVGENGIGKSTLIEGIAVKMGFNAEGGSRKPTDGYFLRAESFYNLATEIEKLDSNAELDPDPKRLPPPIINSYGGNSLHAQSHGESFFSLLQKRLGGNGLYIFDEPEAALSPRRQMSLLTLMHRLVEKNSQFIISTHSPILLAYPNAWIYLLTEKGMKKVCYTDTDHFQVTRDFLNRHEKMLEILLQ